jgi:NAD(P)H-hydrate epimerase
VTPVLSREQVRALDRDAIDRLGVPSLLLMENAGRGAAHVVDQRLVAAPGPVAVVCGAGNNGGDGFVVARRLRALGYEVRVALVARTDALRGDARANYEAWLTAGGTVASVDEANLGDLDVLLGGVRVVVDALLGTGLDRPVTGLAEQVIERINRTGAGAYRIAIDVPSGMDTNTGQPMGVAVRADETVTFAATKLGLVTSTGAALAGQVTVVDIGIPPSSMERTGTSARILEPADVGTWIERRPLSTHKGAAGRVVAVAGSPGKIGAALLVARGALRAGAGLVTLATTPQAAAALESRVLEEMTARIDPASPISSLEEHLAAADVAVIGPGLGLDEKARALVDHAVLRHDGLVVVDADALTHLSGRLRDLRAVGSKRVLTPHPGEMARLLGITTTEVERDRFRALARAVDESGATVLLKGARTLIGAPGVLPVVNPSGSPALATAGAGDVLSGIVAALLASLRRPFEAACAAAYVHGESAEEWCRQRDGADRGLLAHEVADGAPRVIAGLTRSRTPLPV